MTKKEQVLSFVKSKNGEITKFQEQQNLMNKLYPKEQRVYGQDPIIDDYNVALDHLNHYASWDWLDSIMDNAFIAMNDLNLAVERMQERHKNNEKYNTKFLGSENIKKMYESLR